MSGLGVYITKFVTVHDRFSQTFEFRVGENLAMTEVMGTFANEKENLNFELEKNVNPPSLSFSRLAGVYIDGNEVVIQLKINPLTTVQLIGYK